MGRRMVRLLLPMFSVALFAPVASAQLQLPDDPLFAPKTLNSFEEAATFTATFVPAKAKPGEPVTLKLTISPNIGCWTYPGNQRMGQTGTNTFILPKEGDVFFLSKFEDPPKHKVKKTGDWYYPEEVTWYFKAAVNPAAKAGVKKIELPDVRLQVCNDKNCVYFGKLDKVSADLEILAGAAVNLPPEFREFESPVVAPPSPRNAANPADTQPKSDELVGIIKKKAIAPSEHEAKLNDLLSNLQKLDVKREGGLTGLLLTAAAWGLISLVTPCVFPMIPITVSLFLKQSNQSASGG